MRKITSFLFAFLFVCLVAVPHAYADDTKKDSKAVYLTKMWKIVSVERGAVRNVELFYDSGSKLLELSCWGTQLTTIYIVDSSNELVSEDYFNSEMNPTIIIDAPEASGRYHVVIDSPIVYAEGMFIVE